MEPGRLIGDLAIILDEPRQLDLITEEDSQFLRLGAEQFRSVIEHEPRVLMILLQTVASHLTGAAELLREARVNVRQAAEQHKNQLAAEAASDNAQAE